MSDKKRITGSAEGSSPRKNAVKTRGKPFPPGNPGRPAGSRNKSTIAFESLLEGQYEALTQKMVSLALEGDIGALKYCLDKIIPLKRGISIKLNLPKVKTAKDIVNSSCAVIDLLAAGEISPSDAAEFLVVLNAHLKIVSAANLDERVQRLEENSGRKRVQDMTPEERRSALEAVIREVQENARKMIGDGSKRDAVPISDKRAR